MLTDILKDNKCFKLICGAGNEDVDEIEKLTALYSQAGCSFFDICANEKVIDAAKRGLKRVGKENSAYLCISVGVESDQHFCKAQIDEQNCIKCGQCKDICLQQAIEISENKSEVNTKKCIGCKKCVEICPQECISLVQKPTDLEELLPSLIAKGLDCIELHVAGNDDEDYFNRWKQINEMFTGILSISINRSVLGDEKLIDTVKQLLSIRKPYDTIIQADGIPMSGGKNSYKSTLQAVATADLFLGANLDAYVIASGGTNEKTTELAKLCEVPMNGVAIGSYARKIVKEYTSRNDFFENKEIYNKALEIAKNLVETSLKHLS